MVIPDIREKILMTSWQQSFGPPGGENFKVIVSRIPCLPLFLSISSFKWNGKGIFMETTKAQNGQC